MSTEESKNALAGISFFAVKLVIRRKIDLKFAQPPEGSLFAAIAVNCQRLMVAGMDFYVVAFL